MEKYYLGIDQGTTGTTVLLVDSNLAVVGRGYKKHSQILPQPGWVEHDPAEIFEAIMVACKLALEKANVNFSQVAGIGLDHQGETCTIWNKQTGEVLYNAIVWQDRRTSDYCKLLREQHGETIKEITGLVPDAYFSASKLRWLIQNVVGAKELIKSDNLLAGTLDAYLIWKLTAGKSFYTDPASAGRTMLMDIRTAQWSQTMLDMLEIPKNILPQILDTCSIRGYTEPNEFFDRRIPICASITDACAAMLGHGCAEPGTFKTSYGTGCFMHMSVGEHPIISEKQLLTALPYKKNNDKIYCLGGNVYTAGAAINWMQKEMKLFETYEQAQNMARAVEDTNGVYFVPAFFGLGVPWWDQYARGLIIGLSSSTKSNHLVRALLESIALQVYDVAHTMKEEASKDIVSMRADGGLVDNEFLMQFQADILGIPVEIPEEKEMTAFGSAFLAAYSQNEYSKLTDVRAKMKLKTIYKPKISAMKRENIIENWHRAISRSLKWEQQE